MRLNKEQIVLLSHYFSDVSKITFGSAVLGFFMPTAAGDITILVFFSGILATAACLMFSTILLK